MSPRNARATGSIDGRAGRRSQRKVPIMTFSDDVQEPRAMVVFESMFGNTEQVARAVADGLRGRRRPDQGRRGVGGAGSSAAVRRAPCRRCSHPCVLAQQTQDQDRGRASGCR